MTDLLEILSEKFLDTVSDLDTIDKDKLASVCDEVNKYIEQNPTSVEGLKLRYEIEFFQNKQKNV